MLVLLFLNFSILKNVRYGTLAIKVYNIFYFLFPKTNSVRTWDRIQQKWIFLEILNTLFQALCKMSNFCGKKKKKKSHTCEECGAHLRILVWHLLMSRTWKTTIKNLLKWANKKCKTFNIYNVVYILKK